MIHNTWPAIIFKKKLCGKEKTFEISLGIKRNNNNNMWDGVAEGINASIAMHTVAG